MIDFNAVDTADLASGERSWKFLTRMMNDLQDEVNELLVEPRTEKPDYYRGQLSVILELKKDFSDIESRLFSKE